MSVIITAGLAASTPDQPLTHARWGYQRVRGEVEASSAAQGAPALAADSPFTYTFWRPETMPATWQITPDSIQTVNYVGIAAHTIGSSGGTVGVEFWDGADWTLVAETTPEDNSAILFLFEDVEDGEIWRLTLTGPAAPRVGVVYAGKTLDMERPLYGGHSPINLSRQTVYANNVSERGQWLGRSIVRSGSATSLSWDHLTPGWYRAQFDPLVVHLRKEPAFVAWRPIKWPDGVAYVWTNADIQPSNMGVRDLMEVSVAVEGVGDD